MKFYSCLLMEGKRLDCIIKGVNKNLQTVTRPLYIAFYDWCDVYFCYLVAPLSKEVIPGTDRFFSKGRAQHGIRTPSAYNIHGILRSIYRWSCVRDWATAGAEVEEYEMITTNLAQARKEDSETRDRASLQWPCFGDMKWEPFNSLGIWYCLFHECSKPNSGSTDVTKRWATLLIPKSWSCSTSKDIDNGSQP